MVNKKVTSTNEWLTQVIMKLYSGSNTNVRVSGIKSELCGKCWYTVRIGAEFPTVYNRTFNYHP